MINAAFILETGAFHDIYGAECVTAIAQHAHILGPTPLTAAELALHPPAWLAEVDVIFTGWGAPVLDVTLLSRLPRLRAVFYGAGSLRSVVTEACWQRDLVFTSAAGSNAIPVIEYTLGAILLSFKRAWHHARAARANHHYEPLRALPIPTGWQATVGLLALGLIGRGVAQHLRSFDVRVIAHDPLTAPSVFAELGVESVSLEELFQRADILSVHAPLLPATMGLIDRPLLDRLKPGATFINTARGGLIRERDLTDFLEARPDVQAILDVTEPEPPGPLSPLYQLPNVFLTPHIAGSIGPECRRMGKVMVREFHAYLRGEPFQHAVTRDQLSHLA